MVSAIAVVTQRLTPEHLALPVGRAATGRAARHFGEFSRRRQIAGEREAWPRAMLTGFFTTASSLIRLATGASEKRGAWPGPRPPGGAAAQPLLRDRRAVPTLIHAACLRAIEQLRGPLGTVWPVLTGVVYLVQRWPGAQMELLNLVETGALRILPSGRDDVPRVKALMTKYCDLPMDLADAALVRVAEREGIRPIFTIDRRDFSLYHPLALGRFKIIP